ncbi:hypothetical protein ACSQ67_019197 [Phaseolus vulgaris]
MEQSKECNCEIAACDLVFTVRNSFLLSADCRALKDVDACNGSFGQESKTVPQFGDWDQKGQVPDYSLDFSKIREMRKQNKTNISRASLDKEELPELLQLLRKSLMLLRI